ncbi:MAG: adenylate kinase [Synergistetes bacterium]|nr:adenylate kinase [Synergistota bacterium]
MNAIFIGPPGAGKGTVASMLHDECGYVPLSTGDILRRAVKEGTELGIKAKDYMDRGELVPDDVIIGIVKEYMATNDSAKGFIFDGFPRTIAQAEALQEMTQIDCVFLLDASEDVVIERLSGRRVCKKCGAIYHIKNHPPKVEGVCDICGGELYQRDDDREQTIRMRLRVYREQTAPLIDFYREKGLLVDIDANRDAVENAREIADYIKRHCSN